MWLTELSWPASKGKTGGPKGFVTSEKGQASRLKLALKLLAKARKRLKIGHVYLVHVAVARGLGERVQLVGAAARCGATGSSARGRWRCTARRRAS